MGTVTGTIYKGGVPWPDVEVYFDIVKVFSDGEFSYPAARLPTTTDDDGEITPVVLPTPDNGSIQVRLTLPSRETKLFWHSTADGDITIEEIILGAGTEQQIDTLATLLTQYLRLDGGAMTGTLTLAADPVEDLEAATKQYVDDNAGGGGGISDISELTATGYDDGSYINVLSEGFQERTAAQVLSGIGAAAAVHTHSYLANIVEDTTPQLGGNLDLNGNVITGLEIGTNVQAYSAKTAAIAALTWAANSLILLTGTGTAAVQALAAHMVTFLQSADAAAARVAILASPLRPDGVDIAGTTHTFALTNEGAIVRSTSGSATVFTVPLNSGVAFPTGTIIGWAQKGAGELSIAATGGVTINSLNGYLKAAGQHAEGALRKTDTNTWDLIGALKA